MIIKEWKEYHKALDKKEYYIHIPFRFAFYLQMNRWVRICLGKKVYTRQEWTEQPDGIPVDYANND